MRDAGGFRIRQLDCGRALLSMRPRPTGGAIHQTDTGLILRSDDGARHVRVGVEEAFLWKQIDGRVSVEELATVWFLRFGSFEFGQILRFIQLARRNGFIETTPTGILRSRFVSPWFDQEIRWTDVQHGAVAMHSCIRPLLRPAAAIGVIAMVVAGTSVRLTNAFHPPPAYVLAFAGFWLLHMIPHEAAHALACVGFGRRVRAVGLSWHGVFVDTTDMYLSSRRNHALVALAGPASNLLLASLATLAAVSLPVAAWRGVAGVAADAGYAMAFVSGWPFFLAGDGYNALCDVLRAPRLRADAIASVRCGKLTGRAVAYLSSVLVTWAAVVWFVTHA